MYELKLVTIKTRALKATIDDQFIGLSARMPHHTDHIRTLDAVRRFNVHKRYDISFAQTHLKINLTVYGALYPTNFSFSGAILILWDFVDGSGIESDSFPRVYMILMYIKLLI
jgi:hypothetical protein